MASETQGSSRGLLRADAEAIFDLLVGGNYYMNSPTRLALTLIFKFYLSASSLDPACAMNLSLLSY